MTKEFTVRSMESEALASTFRVRHPDQAARLWAMEWLDTSGDERTVLVTCGGQSWRFEVSVPAPEYEVKEVKKDPFMAPAPILEAPAPIITEGQKF